MLCYFHCATTSKLFWSPIEPPQDQNRLTSKPGSLFILWRPGILNISTSVRMIPCPFNPKPEPNDDSEDDIQNRVNFFFLTHLKKVYNSAAWYLNEYELVNNESGKLLN